MATKRVIELDERTTLDMNDYLLVDSQTSTRKLAMSTLFNYMTLTTMVFVTELPTTDISESTIYLLPHSGSNTEWDEYVYRDGAWVIIGTSTIDLSAIYQTKTDNTLLTITKTIVGAINELFGRLRANNNNFTAAYSDGKYGFTIDNQFYEIGGAGMNANFSKPITVTLGTAVSKDCIVYVMRNGHTTCSITINNNPVATGQVNSGIHSGFEYGSFALKTGDIINGTNVVIDGAFETI